MVEVKRAFLRAVLLLALLSLSPVGGAEPAAGKVQVKTLEFGYRLESGKLRARVILTTGQSLEFEVLERETFLGVAQVFAAGRARLAAEIADGQVVALDVSIP